MTAPSSLLLAAAALVSIASHSDCRPQVVSCNVCARDSLGAAPHREAGLPPLEPLAGKQSLARPV